MRAVLIALAAVAAFPAPAAAGVTSSVENAMLTVASDGADAIVVECSGGDVLVNDGPPDTGRARCFDVTAVRVSGGPGDNRIDVSRFTPTNGAWKGISAYAWLSGGAGDDDLVGPRGAVMVTFDGGVGDDRLEGAAVDKYVFVPVDDPEVDTIVEIDQTGCGPPYEEIEQPGVSWWTVPWDVVDFSALPSTAPVEADFGKTFGTAAAHANRIVRLELGTATIDALLGGGADDVLAGACFLSGGGGDDRLIGTREADLLLGGDGTDVLHGLAGRDKLAGEKGADSLHGDDGTDELIGGPGDDRLAGGNHGDVYQFTHADGRQRDSVVERPALGLDVVSLVFPRLVGASVDLASRGLLARAGGTSVVTDGTATVEGAIGGEGNDRLVGDTRANHFWSGGGVDVAIGGPGDDAYHADWSASMPEMAFTWLEAHGSHLGVFPDVGPYRNELARATLSIVERPFGGRDTLDVAEIWASSEGSGARLEGAIRSGVRVDLTADRAILRTPRVTVLAGTPTTPASLENVRGTFHPDTIIGNAAANLLEGRHERDRVFGGAGRDTCVVERRTTGGRDALRGCERVVRADPDR